MVDERVDLNRLYLDGELDVDLRQVKVIEEICEFLFCWHQVRIYLGDIVPIDQGFPDLVYCDFYRPFLHYLEPNRL